jgi:hypothetical protein
MSSTHLGPKTGFLLLSDSSVFDDVRLLDERIGLSFTIAAGLASTVIIRSETHRTHGHILLSQDSRIPQPGGPGPRIYIAKEEGGLIRPSDTGFPFHCLL